MIVSLKKKTKRVAVKIISLEMFYGKRKEKMKLDQYWEIQRTAFS